MGRAEVGREEKDRRSPSWRSRISSPLLLLARGHVRGKERNATSARHMMVLFLDSVPGGYIVRVETKERECWKFLDWRLNQENDSRVHGQPSNAANHGST